MFPSRNFEKHCSDVSMLEWQPPVLGKGGRKSYVTCAALFFFFSLRGSQTLKRATTKGSQFQCLDSSCIIALTLSAFTALTILICKINTGSRQQAYPSVQQRNTLLTKIRPTYRPSYPIPLFPLP